ncbi:aminoglycoside phosphotransferase (APT) family kinase protein [Arthrobacter pigmenti]|uniref:Aminoglycoside phosphotransferase (APT) family kinase protein n=1 Tax=Arthrobacter pigmenti TaxID=271432 RepID=A0A846RS36_9MICC|nr:aminoglycoside phosphotransferase (APT) family kinase protein [Arthrobacter pigmenti]
MKRSPMELAALASAAVPGLAPTGVSGAPDDPADFESALLVDEAGKQWRVRAPRHAEASMRLETELQVLRAFTPAVRAEIPFLIPHVAGTVRLGDLRTFVYSHIEGSTRSLEELTAGGKDLAVEVGRAIAAIHELPRTLVSEADLPGYEANEVRQRRLNELDQAATTGRIPSDLLRRWEHALEDVTLWRFNPTVVHGDLHEDNLLFSAGRVCAVTGWTDLTVADPADDFAWLAAAHDADFADRVHAAYLAARSDAADEHLLRRAALAAEFALAQWMVRGLALDDHTMVAEAEDMMHSLSADLAAEEAAASEALAESDMDTPAGFGYEPDAESDSDSGHAQQDDDDPRTGSAGDGDIPESADTTHSGAAHHDSTETSALPVVRQP